jgi:hypothetical protein
VLEYVGKNTPHTKKQKLKLSLCFSLN